MLSTSSNYQRMDDHGTDRNEIIAASKVAAKFCSMGLVSSQKWFQCYVIITDGVLKLYDDEATYHQDPHNVVLQISLSKNHKSSSIKHKPYSQNGEQTIYYYCFYIEIDNGMFFPTKVLKLGCLERRDAEHIINAIARSTRGF